MLSPLTLDFDKSGRWMRKPDTFTTEDLERDTRMRLTVGESGSYPEWYPA